MSIEKIIKNIEYNIINRENSTELLRALEVFTQMPDLFTKLVDAGMFFATHHSIHDGCPNEVVGGCDDCYSGDTEFDNKLDLVESSSILFKSMGNLVYDDSEAESETDDTEDSNEVAEMNPVEMKSCQIGLPSLPGF